MRLTCSAPPHVTTLGAVIAFGLTLNRVVGVCIEGGGLHIMNDYLFGRTVSYLYNARMWIKMCRYCGLGYCDRCFDNGWWIIDG